MTHKRSAGLLLFRRTGEDSDPGVEVLLGHMGGPLWSGRDAGGWAIPKGEYEPDETPRTRPAGSSPRRSGCRRPRARTCHWARYG